MPLDRAGRAEEGRLEANPPFVVYDTSGPYTDPEAEIDVHRGLPPRRGSLIRVVARGGG